MLVVALLAIGCAPSRPALMTKATSMLAASFDDVVIGFKLDDRLTLCHLWQKPDGSVAGFVEMPQYRDVLKAHGFDVSAVKLLPEESGTKDRFGFVTVDHAILRKLPNDTPGDRDNASDLVRGETVWILDRKPDGWTLVHASDGYLGWVEAKSIGLTFDAPTAAELVKKSRANVQQPQPETSSRTPHGFTSPGQLITGLDVRPTTPDGRDVNADRESPAMESRDAVITDARAMLSTKYVWGGKTKDGIDCSGLTQTSFAKHGVMLPRDADEQSGVGRLVATRWFKDALLPADLLFFVSPERGKVHHVAIYLGAGRYIEAAGQDVHERSMTPGDADYDAERAATFGWARRVIE